MRAPHVPGEAKKKKNNLTRRAPLQEFCEARSGVSFEASVLPTNVEHNEVIATSPTAAFIVRPRIVDLQRRRDNKVARVSNLPDPFGPFWSKLPNPCDESLLEANRRKRFGLLLYEFNQYGQCPGMWTEKERMQRFFALVQPAFHAPPYSPWCQENVASGGVTVTAPFFCEYGCKLVLGPNVAIGANCRIVGTGCVKIASYCHIGPNVTFYTEDVRALTGWTKRKVEEGTIIVGGDTTIAGNVVVRPNCTIHPESTILAGAVITRVRAFVVRSRGGAGLD